MSFYETDSSRIPLPLIVLGSRVPGCQTVHHRKTGEFEVKRNEGAICRVDGIDLQIGTSAIQNSENVRLSTRAILVGTSLQIKDVDLHKLQEVIQRRTRLLLSANIVWGERHYDTRFRTPLAADEKATMFWDATLAADMKNFSLKRGDQITIQIKRAIFDVTLPPY